MDGELKRQKFDSKVIGLFGRRNFASRSLINARLFDSQFSADDF